MFKKVAAILADIIGCDDNDVFMETKFTAENGVNPIDIAKLVIECEREFNIEIFDEDVHKFKEVGDVVRYIKEA